MPYVGEIAHDAAKSFLKYHSQLIRDCQRQLKTVKADINYFASLILSHSDQMYSNPILDAILECNINNVSISKSRYYEIIEFTKNINDMPNYVKAPKYQQLINVYVKGFVNSYKKRYELSNQILKSVYYIDLGYKTILYIIRRYFFQVQQLLLTGKSYSFHGIYATISIYGKHRKKSMYGGKACRRVEDWGASMRYLVEQSERLNKETHDLYKKKYISKREFLSRMRPFLYSADNPNGLKWIIYSEKEFDLWLILKTKISKFKPIKIYSITPTNFINNSTKSQIDFTNKVKDISEIIESELLGFRDKIRALERYDMSYCLTTFKNDSKYNIQ